MSAPKLPTDPAALRQLAKRVHEQFKRQSREREARRRRRQAEVAETRAYLESVTVEGPTHEVFLAYLLDLVERLEWSLAGGPADDRVDEIYRLALRAFVPMAEMDWARQRPVGKVQLDQEDANLLVQARIHRRLFAAGKPPDGEVDEVAEMMIMLCEAIEIYILTRFFEGRDACIALLEEITAYLEEEADREPDNEADFWDEQPCYPRDPATAPAAFLAPEPIAARLADAAGVRGFLEGVEPTIAHQQAFHTACRALVERLEHDLEAGEVDPDWEALLWRLLRSSLPLVDPAWLEAHRAPPEDKELDDEKLRQVESLGRICAEMGPGREVAGDPVVAMIGVQMSALHLYLEGRCAMGKAEWDALREAFSRYVNRDRRPEPAPDREQAVEDLRQALRELALRMPLGESEPGQD